MPREAANIKVNKDVATLLAIYCKLHGIKMVDFATKVLSSELKDFEERLKEMRKLRQY